MNYISSPECVSCEVEDGIAILDLRSNQYFSLDQVGATIWEKMGQAVSLDDLTRTLASEYEVTANDCRNDVSDLLDDLLSHGLIRPA